MTSIKMMWHDADPIKQDQTNEAQVRRCTPRSNLRDSGRYAGANPFRRGYCTLRNEFAAIAAEPRDHAVHQWIVESAVDLGD